jgi:hypothetical protein
MRGTEFDRQMTPKCRGAIRHQSAKTTRAWGIARRIVDKCEMGVGRRWRDGRSARLAMSVANQVRAEVPYSESRPLRYIPHTARIASSQRRNEFVSRHFPKKSRTPGKTGGKLKYCYSITHRAPLFGGGRNTSSSTSSAREPAQKMELWQLVTKRGVVSSTSTSKRGMSIMGSGPPNPHAMGDDA